MVAQEKVFFDPGPLIDGDLELVLVRIYPGNDAKGIVPWYHFAMRRPGSSENMGSVELRTRLTPKLAQIGGHIGYEVYEPYRGHRYAASASASLLVSLSE